MYGRTDLALECREALTEENYDGISSESWKKGEVTITKIKITNENGVKAIGKPIGTYITVEVPPFSDDAELFDGRIDAISEQIREFLPKGLVLIAGLGNTEITSDALGPKAANLVLATRHINDELKRVTGLENLAPAATLVPGVLGKTGMETSEIIAGVVRAVKPEAVIVIDALASRNLERLGCTVQLSNTGISPGSGVGNHRKEISEETMGVPVISMGVPTVVDAATLVMGLAELSGVEDPEALGQKVEPEGRGMIVTPREIDLVIERASKLVAMSINCALHPDYDAEDLLSLVS